MEDAYKRRGRREGREAAKEFRKEAIKTQDNREMERRKEGKSVVGLVLT